MLEFKRIINLPFLLEQKSFFLLGPRATGKSFLIKQQLSKDAILFNLLKTDLFFKFSSAPWELEGMINAELQKNKNLGWIVIDEIQKVPALLDEVHRLIEEKGLRFLLTGSSARKLKRGHANLLAGRAWVAHLFPLVYKEIPNFDLDKYLLYGGLAPVYSSKYPQEELNAYVRTYLYEEIQAEGLVRKIPQFSRFLHTAALSNGQLINFAQIASDTGMAASTIKEHYSILEDTLLGFRLNPWIKSKKRKAISTSKFFLFDLGVTNTLAQINTLERNSDLYGRSFEHWLIIEIKAYLDYTRKNEELCFWRSKSGMEVDIIIGNHTAIEIKASKRVSKKDLSGLKALTEENIIKNLYLVSHDPFETISNNINIRHWKSFIEDLWAGKII